MPVPSSSPPTPSSRRRGPWARPEYGEAIAAAERALGLAADLRLPEPARALGYLGSARACLGEREGLGDMHRALAFAIEQGRWPYRRRRPQ